MKDFYKILGVGETATNDQIKKAFKDIAKKELQKMRKSAVDKLLAAKRDKDKAAVNILTFWLEQLKPENLSVWNGQILRAAKKRHEALGYK